MRHEWSTAPDGRAPSTVTGSGPTVPDPSGDAGGLTDDGSAGFDSEDFGADLLGHVADVVSDVFDAGEG